MFTSTRQEGNIVAGSLAGRDVVTINNFSPVPAKTHIERLYDALKEEVNNSGQTIQTIEQLQHFMAAPPSQVARTLADKLIESGRGDIVEVAELAKERATKKIMKFQTSYSAQEIFAYVLGELHNKYLHHVRPLIESGATRAEIDAAFEEKVVCPVMNCMQPSSLGMSPDIVQAFLYFLAGNCHVRWD